MTKIPHLRWWIAGMLFLASVLNYLDRQTPARMWASGWILRRASE